MSEESSRLRRSMTGDETAAHWGRVVRDWQRALQARTRPSAGERPGREK